MKLSILMPVFNEADTVLRAVRHVFDVDFPCETELVVVDDGSTDGTAELLDSINHPSLVRHSHRTNRGKGAAVRTAADLATGDYVVILDADLEYLPEEIPALVDVAVREGVPVVYGSRAFGSHNAYSFWYVMGNKTVTTFANILFNSYLSDVETCLKLMPLDVYRALDVRAHGFGMEAEITAKLLRQGIRPFEVPVTYRARSREAGKKLTWRDGIDALWILLSHRVRRSQHPPPSPPNCPGYGSRCRHPPQAGRTQAGHL